MSTPVVLRRKKEFVEALANYQASDHARSVLAELKLAILLSVFGGGRNTIMTELAKTDRFRTVISDTTRPPKFRDGAMEQDGVNYHFRSEDEVLADIKAGEYLEAEIIHSQQVSGISIRELEDVRRSGKIAINEVDLLGTVNILKAKPDATMIFVLPPNFEEWMRRVKNRETMSEEEFHNRMETAERILTHVLYSTHFRFVINKTVKQAAADIERIMAGEVMPEIEAEGRKITADLLAEVQGYLHARP